MTFADSDRCRRCVCSAAMEEVHEPGDHGSGYIPVLRLGSSVSQRSYARPVCHDDVYGADRGDFVGSGFWSS